MRCIPLLVAVICEVGSATAPARVATHAGACDSNLVNAVASIELDPASPGRAVVLLVTGLPPSAKVVIGAGPVDSEYQPIVTAMADGEGRLQIRLPTVGDFAELVLVVEDEAENVLAISNPVDGEGPGIAPVEPEWI